ncbi:hypothetical protein P872_05995 [Rhodonellum psychrophilum GCM71 = DSM 17998]|uniref:Uncharacterized protein n=1 Tax=Rhodonellum psychrophilum GCM71 = DSM 17998 TaxID=1123057 RepID=U5BYV0_9BACT|nr:hypothetical protein P872_05995 [Rhodonellum psychrophilum GCM71 = DSM 17998]
MRSKFNTENGKELGFGNDFVGNQPVKHKVGESKAFLETKT